MPNYSLQPDPHRRRKHWKGGLARLFLWVTVCAILLGGLFFVLLRLLRQETPSPTTSAIVETTHRTDAKVFRTNFFQFQADDSWSEINNESTENRFVYRSYDGPLVQHDLIIHVNPMSADIDGTRVQPVSITADGKLLVTEGISSHCDNSLPTGSKDRAQMVKFHNVTFNCDADDTVFEVLVGESGGTPLLNIRRPNDTHGRYVIVYRDLTALPSGNPLNEIIKTFQSR